MTRLTAIEIGTNPHDLQFQIMESGGKYAVAISRGPGHNFKLLLSSEAVFEKRESAILTIKTVLLSSFTFVDGRQGDLDVKTIERIMRELEQKDSCSTSSFS